MVTYTLRCYTSCAAKNLETHGKVCQLPASMEHATTPPSIPEVTDEAGESPSWVPMLGVALSAAFLGWLLFL